MQTLLNIIGNVGSTCGDCHTTSCGTCGPAPKSEAPSVITRRHLGKSVLAESVGAVLTGCSTKEPAATTVQAPPAAPALSPELAVVQQSKGPIMTTLEEFYKMGPGPSSSHTMGPMRITYDFFERVSKLPDDQLKRATALKVHLYGSLRATGKGHGTDRASLAGLLGKAPATCPPQFLDALATNPDEAHKVTHGPTTLNLTLKDIVFDATKGDLP